MSKYSKADLYNILNKISDSTIPMLIDECVKNGISINLKVNKEGTVVFSSSEISTINDKKLKRKHIIKHGLGFCSEKSLTKKIS